MKIAGAVFFLFVCSTSLCVGLDLFDWEDIFAIDL